MSFIKRGLVKKWYVSELKLIHSPSTALIAVTVCHSSKKENKDRNMFYFSPTVDGKEVLTVSGENSEVLYVVLHVFFDSLRYFMAP